MLHVKGKKDRKTLPKFSREHSSQGKKVQGKD